MLRTAGRPRTAPVLGRAPALRALGVALVATATAAFAQDAPPWGATPYQAEIATTVEGELALSIVVEAGPTGLRYTAFDGSGVATLEILLVWDGAALTTFVADEPGGAFEPMPGLEAAVLASVVDPSTPEIGLCAAAGVSCAREGDGEVAGRRAVRWTVDAPDLGRSLVWVDAEVGLTLASEGSADGVAVVSELRRFDPTAPDPARLRP